MVNKTRTKQVERRANHCTIPLLFKVMCMLIALLLTVALTGCNTLKAVNYEFGDIHRIYCGSTNTELRAELEAKLTKGGVNIDINYCASFGLVDALLIKPIQQNKT